MNTILVKYGRRIRAQRRKKNIFPAHPGHLYVE